jgi:hypothetical protein
LVGPTSAACSSGAILITKAAVRRIKVTLAETMVYMSSSLKVRKSYCKTDIWRIRPRSVIGAMAMRPKTSRLDLLEQGYELCRALRLPAASDSWCRMRQDRNKNCQLFYTDLMDDRQTIVRRDPAGNLGIKPNDLAPTVHQQVHR